MKKEIDFYPVLEDAYTLVLQDFTATDRETLPPDINSLGVRIYSTYLPDVEFTDDALIYIHTYRKHLEWYAITADALGVEEGAKIPDGSYTISLLVNNSYEVQHQWMCYQQYQEDVEALISQSGFNIDTNETTLEYQNSDKYDFEKMSICYSLMNEIKANMLDGDIASAEEALTKGQRVLKTIT